MLLLVETQWAPGQGPRSQGTYWHSILIEHNVVWEASVVDPLNRLAGLDGHAGWLEDQGTCEQTAR